MSQALSSAQIEKGFKDFKETIMDMLLNDSWGECFDEVKVEGKIIRIILGEKMIELDWAIKDVKSVDEKVGNFSKISELVARCDNDLDSLVLMKAWELFYLEEEWKSKTMTLNAMIGYLSFLSDIIKIMKGKNITDKHNISVGINNSLKKLENTGLLTRGNGFFSRDSFRFSEEGNTSDKK